MQEKVQKEVKVDDDIPSIGVHSSICAVVIVG